MRTFAVLALVATVGIYTLLISGNTELQVIELCGLILIWSIFGLFKLIKKK